MAIEKFTPISSLFSWPEDEFPLLGDTLQDFADEVGIGELTTQSYANGDLEYAFDVILLRNFTFGYALLADLEIQIGDADNFVSFDGRIIVNDGVQVLLEEIALGLRFPTNWIRPVELQDGTFVEITDSDDNPQPYELHFEALNIKVSNKGLNLYGTEGETFDLPPFTIGNTGAILEASDVSFNLDGTGQRPDGAPEDWKGIYIASAKIYIPDLIDKAIEVNDLGLGTGGFYADIETSFPLQYSPEQTPKFNGPLTTSLLGLEGGLSQVALSFENSSWVSGSLTGQALLPFLDDDPISLEISVDASGDFDFRISGYDDFYIDENCIAVQWTAADIQTLASKFSSDFLGDLEGNNILTTMRLIRQGSHIEEVRVDWDFTNVAQTFTIPGLKIKTPDEFLLSLILENESGNGQLPHQARLVTTFEHSTVLDDPPVKFTSNFAWTRDEDREIQNDAGDAQVESLLELSLNVDENAIRASLILLSFKLNEAKLPTFLRQYETPLEILRLPNPEIAIEVEAFCQTTLTGNTIQSLQSGTFDADFKVNLEAVSERFRLPFLNKKESPGDSTGLEQFIDVRRAGAPQISLDEGKVSVPLGLLVGVGKLKFDTEINLDFDWEKFAFSINHNGGIDLILEGNPEIVTKDFLGLDWTFKGKAVDNDRYHYFTLVTKNYNYQLKQAEGADFVIGYTKASKEPITFSIKDFVLSPKGLNITAEVTDQPTTLNGINQKFTFSGTKLTIVENRIKDFTLSGSGPLPPDLVGEGMADVSLQFAQRNGALTLLSGAAQLQGNKLLEAKNTRFSFQVDGMGLRFVNENGFQLYFTLTGAASFVLAPADDRDGPLAPLSKIKIEFVDCPLTGDSSVIAKHIKFLVELPKPVSFKFLGCFEMELRGFGFIPQAKVFNGDAAMLLSGQVLFSVGGHDTKSGRVDFHGLHIGIPEKGKFRPRISLKQLALEIKFGDAFRLAGSVSFEDTSTVKGFMGQGMVEIKGLPSLAATFSFVRVRQDADSNWVRAWFIYLEVRKITLKIPVIELYIREIGLGFGYRYTITSIKAADQTNDIGQLLKELRKQSRTQGNLSSLDSWALDLENKGEDPRWTIVFRAMISQTATSTPLRYNESGERNLPCTFLFDAIVAFRSDLTFFMAVRVWLNTNYNDFLTSQQVKERPLLSGFVLLSARQKRFLASISTNPNGLIGDHPPFPDFIKRAIANSQFSITLLIEPGLFHYEMGWPNQLRWGDRIGPLEVEVRGGFIFRVSTKELVVGYSIMARGKLEIKQSLDLGIVGVRVYALAQVAYGARFIGVIDFDEAGDSAFYGAVGLEIRVKFSVNFWIKIKLGFVKVKISIGFSLTIGFTASLEVGVQSGGPGLRGRATISIGALGKRIRLGIKVGLLEDNVDGARAKTEKYLNIGLEATDVEPVPGTGSGNTSSAISRGLEMARRAAPFALRSRSTLLSLSQPGYSIFLIREPINGQIYFVLIPQGESTTANQGEEPGFLPVPPKDASSVSHDFELILPEAPNGFTLEQYLPANNSGISAPEGEFVVRSSDNFNWKINWELPFIDTEGYEAFDPETGEPLENPGTDFTLAAYFRNAFVKVLLDPNSDPDDVDNFQLFDPQPFAGAQTKVEDARVQNPTDNAFESAVRGAVEQFRGSPYFKRDPNNEYDRLLERAFADNTSIYGDPDSGEVDNTQSEERLAAEQADQMRGMVVHDLIVDLQNYAKALKTDSSAQPNFIDKSFAFQMGLVFRISTEDITALPNWLDRTTDASAIRIKQRQNESSTQADGELRYARTFNIRATDFSVNPPQFQRTRQYTDANTIAITWDLVWTTSPDDQCTACQLEPEHHLNNYEIHRRTIDNSEPEVVYTLKNADVLSIEDACLKVLQPRFKLVDHFNQESLADQAALPEEGRTYVYSIVPVDFSGEKGRALTVIATRFPNLPPQIPVDSELVVTYEIDSIQLDPSAAVPPLKPNVLNPASVEAKWKDALAIKEGPEVPIRTYRLIFRKEEVLPLGNYGLDGETQGARNKKLPTSNARPLPTDIKIDLDESGPRTDRRAEIPLEELRQKGILPTDTRGWQPEAWSVFMQTISINGVPSSLVPVQLLLEIRNANSTSNEQVEQRKPAHLEWITEALLFGLLPPFDQQSEVGTAHFPMPFSSDNKLAENFRFSLAYNEGRSEVKVENIQHREHPAGIRAVRFRFNQGPSNQPSYPLAMNAGYDILELDIDAFTTDVYNGTGIDPNEDQKRLRRALRELQEIRMVPAEDLLLIPGDTLTVSQWECWYPSRICRLRTELAPTARIDGSETPFGPWYSWRDSILEWPQWPGLTDSIAPQRTVFFHPYLQALIQLITETGDGLVYTIDQQIPPPILPGDLKQFISATAPSTDPYGWNTLQRFGLSITFSVRKAVDGELLLGDGPEDDNLLQLLDEIIQQIDGMDDEALQEAGIAASVQALQALKKHLHVELLYQQGKAVTFQEQSASAAALLGIVQLSLRPKVQQNHAYRRLYVTTSSSFADNENYAFKLKIANSPYATLLHNTDDASGEIQLKANDSGVIEAVFTINAQKPKLELLVRTLRTTPQEVLQVGLPLIDLTINTSALESLGELVDNILYVNLESLSSSFDSIVAILGPADQYLANLMFEYEAVPAASESVTAFTVPPYLQEQFEVDGIIEEAWLDFKRYAESSNSLEEGDPVIEIPVDGPELESFLATYLAWSQRFMDHSAFITINAEGFGETESGPWLATAYPRAGTPAYATPDASGRIKYDHLIEDQWAHNYRYYVRPYGRYDLLWNSFRQSPALQNSPTAEISLLPKAIPEPGSDTGGLDVVLDRTKKIAAPVVLYSGRLDEPSTPGRPASPGTTWEVILAQHPEQALLERNQTLYRRLSYRQIAFSLVRRINAQVLEYPEKLQRALVSINGQPTTLFAFDYAEHLDREIPPYLPTHLDHTESSVLTTDEQLALSVPLRSGKYSQNALIIQWKSLPFFYETKLLAIAQSSDTVSSITSVTQDEFHYQAPEPYGELGYYLPIDDQEEPAKSDGPRIIIDLKRLWDSLSPTAQQQWDLEAPNNPSIAAGKGRFSALPDLDVVYQLVELYNGNIEVQTEYFYTDISETTGTFESKQLGKRFLPWPIQEIREISDPKTELFQLIIPFSLEPVTVPILRDYSALYTASSDGEDLQADTYDRENQLLQFCSILTPDFIVDLLWRMVGDENPARQELGEVEYSIEEAQLFLDNYYTTRSLVRRLAIDQLSDGLNAKVELLGIIKLEAFPSTLRSRIELGDNEIYWHGSIDETGMLTFQNWLGSPTAPLMNEQRQSLGELVDFLENDFQAFTTDYIPLLTPFPDVLLPEVFSLNIEPDASSQTLWQLLWQGGMSVEDEVYLLSLETAESYQEAVLQLRPMIAAGLNATVEINEPFLEIPEGNFGELTIGIIVDDNGNQVQRLSWNGQMTEEQANELLAFADELPDAASKLEQLISDIRTQEQSQVASATAIMEWPLFDLQKLSEQTGIAFAELELLNPLDEGRLVWNRPAYHPHSTAEIRSRVQQILREIDPLRGALESIFDQLEGIVTEGILINENWLRILAPITEIQRDELISALGDDIELTDPDRLAIEGMYADLYDRFQLERASRNAKCEVRTSNFASDLSEFPRTYRATSPDTALILSGMDVLAPIVGNTTPNNNLSELTGDTAFTAGVTQLIDMVDETILRVATSIKPTKRLEDLSLLLTSMSFEEDEDQSGMYNALLWQGRITPEQRILLKIAARILEPDDTEEQQLIKRLVDSAELSHAFTELLQKADRQITQVTVSVGPTNIPDELNGQLSFQFDTTGTNYESITWQGNIIGEEELALLRWVTGVPEATEAVDMLLDELEHYPTLSVELVAEIPAEIAIYVQLRSNQVKWFGVAPTTEHMAILEAWSEQPNIALALRSAIDQLITEMQANSSQISFFVGIIPSILVRPAQGEISDLLNQRLLITQTALHWTGLRNTAAEMAELASLVTQGDIAFQEAMQTLIEGIAQQTLTIPFVVPVRPSTDQLSPRLRAYFMIADQRLFHYGPMTVEEGQALASLFNNAADKAAVQRLYNCAQQLLLGGRNIQIRTRRGAAAPSGFTPLAYTDISTVQQTT